MPYCPKCRYEYVAGTEKCPDCDVELVAELSEEPKEAKGETMKEDALVPIFSANNQAELEIVKSILEDAGIKTTERLNTGAWVQPASIGAVTPLDDMLILVLESQAEQAIKVLEEAHKTE